MWSCQVCGLNNSNDDKCKACFTIKPYVTNTTNPKIKSPKSATNPLKMKLPTFHCELCPNKKLYTIEDKESHIKSKYHQKREQKMKSASNAITNASNHIITRQKQRNISDKQLINAKRYGKRSPQNDGSIHYRYNGICYVTRKDANGKEIGVTTFTENQLEFENAALSGKIKMNNKEFIEMMTSKLQRPFHETRALVMDKEKKMCLNRQPIENMSLEEKLHRGIDQKQFDDLCIAHGLPPVYSEEPDPEVGKEQIDSILGDFDRISKAFYEPLRLDYKSIISYSKNERINMAKLWKTKGNEMYGNKKYVEAIECYGKGVLLLDCCYFKNKKKFERNTEMKQLLFTILSNCIQVWLSFAESIKDEEFGNEKYILYLIHALNCCEMSLWVDSTIANRKALYRKCICVHKLGLFEFGDKLINELRNLKQDKMCDILITKIKTEKSKNVQKHDTIQNYLNLIKFNNLRLKNLQKWNGSNCLNLLLAVSEIIRKQKWCVLKGIKWLKETVNIVEEMKLYGFCVLMIVLCIKPQEIGKCFDEFVGYQKIQNKQFIPMKWTDYSDKMRNQISINGQFWMCQQFLSEIIEHCLMIKPWNLNIKTLIKKQVLEYYQIYDLNERHLKWKQFYNRNKDKNKSKLLKPHGRLAKLPEMDECNSGRQLIELGQSDLLNIHAIATARKQFEVVKEIENMAPVTQYDKGLTWLHAMAQHSCLNTIKFVVSLGMNVNITDRVKYGGKRNYLYSQPITAIDYILKSFIENKNNPYYAQKRKGLENTVRFVHSMGGKRYCDLIGTKGNYQETELFQKIMSNDSMTRRFLTIES